MELLKAACIPQQFVSFKVLPIGVYKVTKFSMVDTQQYGTKVRVDFGNQYVYLPQRLNVICDSLDELNKSPKIMVYTGRVASQKNR